MAKTNKTIKPVSINLVKDREKPFLDRFLNWALTGGRVLVMLTEVIALTAFLYRFTLDRQLIDLREKIKQKETIVKFLKKNEDKYRNLQERIDLAKKTENTSSNSVKIFSDVISLTPKGIIFNDFLMSKENIRINANAQSVTALTSFIKALRDYPEIISVSVDKVENRTASALIVISITASLKK